MKIPFPKNFEPQKPLKIYDYQDITIIILLKSFHISQCDVNDLYQKDIIPPDWHLKLPVIKKPHSFQISFQEGLSITVEKTKVSFYVKNYPSQISLERIIVKFINSYIGYNFTKIQIVFRRLITLPRGKRTGFNLLKDNILKLEDSQIKINNILPKKVQLNFLYQYKSFPFLISAIDTPVKKNNNVYPALLFRGIINYELKEKLEHNKINSTDIITNYPQFLSFFIQVINQHFLNLY